MTALQAGLLAENDVMLGAAVNALHFTIQTWDMTLWDLFASDDAAAAVATRLVQLLAHPSGPILHATWLVCSQLSENSAHRQLLLDAGLLQPVHFALAMASTDADTRGDASELLNLCARNNRTVRVIAERKLLPVILTACNDDHDRVIECGIGGLFRCISAADSPESANLRPVILQACAAAVFPSAALTSFVKAHRLTNSFSKLILAWSLLLRWSESSVDSARLHPLAQRLVDAGLLPHIEGQSHKQERRV